MSPAGRPTQTTPEEWAQAALDTIEQSGLASVTVERVARRLGVSKGGFYHHYADRRALIRAALALWEERFVIGLVERFDAVPGARERLHVLLLHAAVELEPTVITKLMAAAQDDDVAATLRRATESRLALLDRIFRELGLPAASARNRALLAYCAYLGLAQLREQRAGRLDNPRRLRAYVGETEAVLVADLRVSGTAAGSRDRTGTSA